MLRSARYGHSEDGQAAMIGTGGQELGHVLESVYPDCPLDILHLITDLVGHALVWLRAPGLNLVKWSAQRQYEHGEREQANGPDGVRGKKEQLATLSVFGGGCGFSDNEFYFSGYGDEAMEDLVFGLSHRAAGCVQYVDLDWC